MTKKLLWLTLLYLLIVVAPISAQDGLSTEELTVGTLVEGRLDDTTSRQGYSINGTRGAIVRIQLTALNGNLDPTLTIFDPSNNLLMRRDDTAGSQNIDITITFQETGMYLIVVGRFGYALGTTSGDFELSIARVGVSSAEGSSLQYGIPITNTITNTEPRRFFTFEAQAGDIINVSMVRSSGSLDPYIQILDSNRFLVAENDDASGTTQNAFIQNLLIGNTGTYIIVATRYGEAAGNSAGSFVLNVQEANNSGLGNSTLAPAPIPFNQQIQGEITSTRSEVYYTFEGERDQLISIEMNRVQFDGLLDTYLILANAAFQPLIENDDSAGSRNSRISNYRLPADGVYFIIATRFERDEGTTFGFFNLTVTDEGNAFDGVNEGIPRLLYGTTVTDTISATDADSLFVFWGTTGERVILDMTRTDGNLDPVIELLDSNQVRMLVDDNESNTNARIDTVLTYTGVHFIRTTRYSGFSGDANTSGDYRLTLTRILSQ